MVLAAYLQIDIGGWILLALMLPGVIVIVGVVIAFIIRRRENIPPPAASAPGYWRVLGVDSQTGEKRETMFHAESRQSAEGRALLEGIVATEVQPVDESPGSVTENRETQK